MQANAKQAFCVDIRPAAGPVPYHVRILSGQVCECAISITDIYCENTTLGSNETVTVSTGATPDFVSSHCKLKA